MSLQSRSKRAKFALVGLLVLTTLVLAACNTAAQTPGNYAQVPAGKAYAEGQEIYFTHTEASDAGIAETLTNMMDSPVIHVPALADVPESALAQVYVFENGPAGDGPLGFQPDVFNNPPGTEGYSPLREVILVRWADENAASLLTAEADVLSAEADGRVTLTESGVVVNMPFIVWDGGQR